MTPDLNKLASDPTGAPASRPEAPDDSLPVIDAASVLGDAREVWLDFHGVRYRLRVTRRGRLILQK